MGSIFKFFFDIEHIATPVAIEKVNVNYGKRKYRVVYIFGVRVFSQNIS